VPRFEITGVWKIGETKPVAIFLFLGTELHTGLGRKLLTLFTSSAFVPLIPGILASIGLARIKKRFGLTDAEVTKLSLEPSTGSRFWERPSIAQLLTPERVESVRPDSPAALAAAIHQVAAKLDSEVGTIAANAVRVANDLSSGIRDLDAEYAGLNDPAAAAELVAAIRELPRLRLRGLMCVPPEASSLPAQRALWRPGPLLSRVRLGEFLMESMFDPGPPSVQVEEKLREEAARLGGDAAVVVYDHIQPVGAYVNGPLWARDVKTIEGRKLKAIVIKYR